MDQSSEQSKFDRFLSITSSENVGGLFFFAFFALSPVKRLRFIFGEATPATNIGIMTAPSPTVPPPVLLPEREANRSASLASRAKRRRRRCCWILRCLATSAGDNDLFASSPSPGAGFRCLCARCWPESNTRRWRSPVGGFDRSCCSCWAVEDAIRQH